MYKKVDSKNKKVIYIRKCTLLNTFFFELNGVVFGEFRKTPIGFILCIKNKLFRFKNLSKLLNFVEEKVNAKNF